MWAVSGFWVDPNFVLDAAELSAISQRIDIFNQIIFAVANYFGQGVADIHTRFDQFITTPPVVLGVPLTHISGWTLQSGWCSPFRYCPRFHCERVHYCL